MPGIRVPRVHAPRPRRHPLGSVAILVAALLMAGCHEDCDSESPSQPTGIVTQPPAAEVVGVISANHGHLAIVTAAQIQAAQLVAIPIQGTAIHSHTITLTGTQLTQIGQGQRVAVVSTPPSIGEVHVHDVSFN